MGEGAMLASGTFSCGNGGRGHVGFWDIFLWDCCLLEFSSKRVVAASKWVPRNDFCDGSILSEQIYPSAKTFWILTNEHRKINIRKNVVGQMREGAMLSSGTFSCGNGGRGHVVILQGGYRICTGSENRDLGRLADRAAEPFCQSDGCLQ